jgi:hypothetical protein
MKYVKMSSTKPVKSMIDIQELKNEREVIKKNIEELTKTLEKKQNVIHEKEKIRRVIRDLEDVVGICFEGNEKYIAQQVINNLLTCVEEGEKMSISCEEEKSKLEQKMKRLNEKLSAARAVGR